MQAKLRHYIFRTTKKNKSCFFAKMREYHGRDKMESADKSLYKPVPKEEIEVTLELQERQQSENVDEDPDGEDALDKTKSSMWQSVCNLVSDMEGTGLLGLPYVILKGGWAAIGALAVIPCIMYYTGKILVECLYETDTNGCKVRVRSNYREMADASWPRYGGIIAVSVQVIELTLLASLYLVLCASLVHGMLPSLPISERLWMVIAAVIGLPTIFFKHLSQVAWISLISVIALTVAVIIVVGYGVSQNKHWDLTAIPVWDTKGAPLALAIIIFSYICHPVLPGIESSMADREKFNTMLALSYGSVFLVKIIFALSAYLAFSPNINEVITNSLPRGAIHIVINCFLVVNVVFSYPFRVLTIIHTLEDSVIPESFSSKVPDLLWFTFIRIFVNFFTLVPAIAIPHFALLMAFVGSLTGSCVAFVFPCTFHLLLKSSELRWYSKALDVSVIVLGVLAGGFGLVATGNKLASFY